MKNKTEKVLVVLLSVIIVIIAYKIIDPKVKNIFDEMYYGEKKVYSWFGETPFWDIPGIEQWNRNDMKDTSIREDTIVDERYKNKYKTKKIGKWKINFEFIFDTKEIDISFYNEIPEKKISISIHNEYDVGSKRLIEEVRFYNDSENLHESKTKEISKIKEYLKKYDISIKDLKETADELLYEKVIGDWEKYTNSRYSKDNLGTVKIERSPLFDGVD
ncbi:TipC family immunity protein [Parvimonas sp. C2]|uniref:TipC family immunity protein n=1 Tax=Parvimonas sp. C2 TaxID=3110692 RepID=UPI002B4A6089|nr:TipC family immunity protein [Parvimonas sp. C2]MEB3072675.1 TipC family immunity protein [Parvimonas sp. C2]